MDVEAQISLGVPELTRKFSSQELLSGLALLDLTKSPGPDGLLGQMLENLGLIGKQRLLDIINHSYSCGKLPADWKRATVIPIRKPSREASSLESYKPIAFTCMTCKIMEKIFLARLHYFLDLNHLMPPEQYGFRKEHSTTDQVLYFCQKVRDAQNHKLTRNTMAAFLDLSKAFDTVWKDKLIIKLHDLFNIRGSALVWIADFVHHRSIRVKFNSTFSDPFRLGQGVPQGSVLSPTLFSLFLAGIEKRKPDPVDIAIFADDIVIWMSDTELYFDSQPLTYEKHPKYLGFILDPEFNSNKHIDHLVSKARKRLNILKYLAGRDWGADAITLRTTYISLIRPILEYGYPIYSCASETNLQKLERVQLSAARIILGLRNSCPSVIALFEANLQPLHIRRRANLVKYFNKIDSFGPQHHTSFYLHTWCNNQTLKKNSPFSLAESRNLICREVEPQSLRSCIDPSVGMPRVFFHFDLNSTANKQTHLDVHLKQLALEIISSNPKDVVQVCTDGSRTENRTGSGIYIRTPHLDTTLKQRNPYTYSVFRSELIATNKGLDVILSYDINFGELLSDRRSALQHLSNWSSAVDETSIYSTKTKEDFSEP
ncbi:probable RNA-directed DNA polymerase from transposon BS [Trichonephila clavipes]|nr:probable RNA-directed DNA polymerase from transposon BS [Trichonephila clavipes]